MARCGPCDNVDVASQKRVTLQRPDPDAEIDAAGHVDLTNPANWINVGYAWGTPKSRGGREYYLFSQVQAEVSSIWDFRWSSVTSQIQPTWRIVYQGRHLNISAVFNVDEGDRIIRCHCVEEK